MPEDYNAIWALLSLIWALSTVVLNKQYYRSGYLQTIYLLYLCNRFYDMPVHNIITAENDMKLVRCDKLTFVLSTL